jgi:hypothetical protein
LQLATVNPGGGVVRDSRRRRCQARRSLLVDLAGAGSGVLVELTSFFSRHSAALVLDNWASPLDVNDKLLLAFGEYNEQQFLQIKHHLAPRLTPVLYSTEKWKLDY